MPTFFCCNPLCPRLDGFPQVECPDCHYSIWINNIYKSVQSPSNKNDLQFSIKVQREVPGEAKAYNLKIIKQPNDVNTDLDVVNRFKSQIDKDAKTTALIDIFQTEFSKDKNDKFSQIEKYDCIVFEFIDGQNIIEQKDRIKKSYKKKFILLLKTLNSIHKLEITHEKITTSNILFHENSWKIVDIYPKKNRRAQAKKEDLKALTKIYKELFHDESEDPFHDTRNNLVVERVINNILNNRHIFTAEEAIRKLDNKYIYYLTFGYSHLWKSIKTGIQSIKEIDSAVKTTISIAIIVVAFFGILGAFITGKNPIKLARIIFLHLAENKEITDIQIKSPEEKQHILSDEQFTNYLKEIEVQLKKNDLIDADIKTRKLMLKVFYKDPKDEQSNSQVIHNDVIKIDFEKSQNSNGGPEIGIERIISLKQKKRVKEIDRVWFHGTGGKHGFYQQQKVYDTVSSDYACNKTKNVSISTEKDKDNDHVDATFKALGWGSIGCDRTKQKIPNQIYDIMKGSEIWKEKRQKIQEVFKKNGGVGDDKNVPDGYYPITAGLVAQKQFPQFAKWCEYTKEEFEEDKNTH